MSRDAIQRLVRRGEWRRRAPNVYQVFVAGTQWLCDVVTIGLWLGDAGAVSHRSAAAWWHLDGFEPTTLEFSVDRRRRFPRNGVNVHVVSGFGGGARGQANGIWITTPTRTVIDLAAVAEYDALEAATHCALRHKLTSVSQLQAYAAVLKARGRTGSRHLRRLVEDLSTSGGPTGSALETRFMQLVRRAGLPSPKRQIEIFDERGRIGRVDFAYPDRKLAIEVQSYEFHSERDAWVMDQAKWDRLYSSGWRPRLVTKEAMDLPNRLLADLSRELGVTSLLDQMA